MDVHMDSWLNSTSIATNDTFLYTTAPLVALCRTREGQFPPELFTIITCAFCYKYVYVDYNVTVDEGTYELVFGKNTEYPEGTRMWVDPDNAESISMICGSLRQRYDCWKWKECCRQARICCQEQLAQGPRLDQEYARTLCPRTWDGYSCWPDTPAGMTPRNHCPAHVPLADTGRYAYKTCTQNGTWYSIPPFSSEWTDYTECSSMDHYQRVHSAALACNIITILLLIPACFILLYYRPLRHQHRIRLHVCLMVSSFLTSVSLLIWEVIIFKDTMESEVRSEVTAHKNSVGCRFLSALTRYSELASFMWMFIEGFHLHRLLVHAFSVPKALAPYYTFGFGFPILPVAVYSIVRSTNSQFNQRCWINSTGAYEWILFAPSLASLLANIIFLFRIVYIMIRQLERHPDEPSCFRRAVKAVVVLVPLFGVQLLLFIYRPQEENAFSHALELLSKISSSLQGAFIAITVCYINKEVQSYLTTSCMRLMGQRARKDTSSRSFTLTTQCNSELSRTNGSSETSHMIALRPVSHLSSPDETSFNETSLELMNGSLHLIPENFDE